ncbi:MAG: cupin domain-containing protein [Sphaerochaetaceae bacterium]|jgi:quercetin dioxygenase-like cupin family protein|nr:cupin domain-containing protein [Spirochaetaceae bacterium]MDY6342944.1 cupin domain-containing protein [Sphaerochaetaceae bacterium]
MLCYNKDAIFKDLGGGVTRKIVAYDEGMMVCELTFKKGAVGTPHHHPHEQIGYIISGSFEVTDGEETKVLKAGDCYLVKPDSVHGVKALEDSKLLDVFTPMRKDFLA